MKIDYLALGAAATYIGAKYVASRATNEKVKFLAFKLADVVLAAQIYIVVARLRETVLPAVVELPAPVVAQTPAVQSTA